MTPKEEQFQLEVVALFKRFNVHMFTRKGFEDEDESFLCLGYPYENTSPKKTVWRLQDLLS